MLAPFVNDNYYHLYLKLQEVIPKKMKFYDWRQLPLLVLRGIVTGLAVAGVIFIYSLSWLPYV